LCADDGRWNERSAAVILCAAGHDLCGDGCAARHGGEYVSLFAACVAASADASFVSGMKVGLVELHKTGR